MGERRMKKTISIVALTSILAAGTAYGSGYRIPEQSADSTAKAGANVASALGADASYFNPANMSFMANDGWVVEGDLSYIHLTEIEYEDNNVAFLNHESKDENFLVPTAFMVSPDYNGFHVGLSVTAPYGLAKRWPDGYGAFFSEKFELKVIEFNPTVSYKIHNNISFAAGARVLYSSATVMRKGGSLLGLPADASLYVDGDTIDYGWNAALAVKPTEESNISLTYRSHVDLDFEGDVRIDTVPSSFPIATDGDVTVPAPAVLALSGSYDFDKLTVELTIDRTFWSEYEELDFEYDVPVGPLFTPLFDAPVTKDWDDTNAYRLSMEYRLNSDVTLMGGLAYDENPVPDKYLSFELPDSDAWIISAGARFAVSEKSEIAFGVLYDYKESRDVVNAKGINGEFTNASAYFASLGYTYRF